MRISDRWYKEETRGENTQEVKKSKPIDEEKMHEREK
jgi:hypothetical protein